MVEYWSFLASLKDLIALSLGRPYWGLSILKGGLQERWGRTFLFWLRAKMDAPNADWYNR